VPGVDPGENACAIRLSPFFFTFYAGAAFAALALMGLLLKVWQR
jgi:hypothetical protein